MFKVNISDDKESNQLYLTKSKLANSLNISKCYEVYIVNGYA